MRGSDYWAIGLCAKRLDGRWESESRIGMMGMDIRMGIARVVEGMIYPPSGCGFHSI